MLKINSDLQIPVVVTPKAGCNIYIPDFKMTVHGENYVEAFADAIFKASAIYYYNLERNLKFQLNTTYEAAEQMCTEKGSFVTFICLTT